MTGSGARAPDMAIDSSDGPSNLDVLASRLAALCSQAEDTLDAYFVSADAPVVLANMSTTAHCHILRREGNGAPRVNGLASLLARKVIDYAMPRSEITKAAEEYERTGSTAPWVRLTRKASGLFTHIKNTGEGGELLLYLLAESYRRLPQVVSKMHLKTNPQVHYHGVDGIHASLDARTGMLALWWGESKLYQTLSTGIAACLDSIGKYVMPDAPDGSPVERDVDILSAYADLTDQDLLEAFKRFLNPDDTHFNRVQYRGICLVGFDETEYPEPLTDDPVVFSDEVRASIEGWRATTAAAVVDHRLESTVLHVFLIPFPSVEDLRQAFLRELG